MHDPQEPHLTAMKHIMRYLRGSMDFGLPLRRSASSELSVYTDADWADRSIDIGSNPDAAHLHA
jgi:hypothetical protein